MALMHLARRWLQLTGRPPSSILVLTVDHQLRAGSASEAAFAAGEAASAGFAHSTLSWSGPKPKSGLQAAARRARYDLLTAACRDRSASCLSTAHTADDQAETFLMRLRRGSGLDGLAAMAAVSEQAGLPLLRPLLGFSKARLTAYLRSRSLPFVSDPSNSDMTFERVRLRHAMKALGQAGIAPHALSLSASRLGRAREALLRGAVEFLERNFTVCCLGQGEIRLDEFDELAEEIELRVLSRALILIGGKTESPRLAKVERLLGELRAGRREASLGGCLVIKGSATLHLYREPGRTEGLRMRCQAGSQTIWDGRFALTFASHLDSGVEVAPLGASGWSAYCERLEKRRKPYGIQRLAALTTPALWRDKCLLAAPLLSHTDACPAPAPSPLVTAQLVPRLSHFQKPPKTEE